MKHPQALHKSRDRSQVFWPLLQCVNFPNLPQGNICWADGIVKFPGEAFGCNNKQGQATPWWDQGVTAVLALGLRGACSTLFFIVPAAYGRVLKLWAGPIWVRGLFEFKWWGERLRGLQSSDRPIAYAATGVHTWGFSRSRSWFLIWQAQRCSLTNTHELIWAIINFLAMFALLLGQSPSFLILLCVPRGQRDGHQWNPDPLTFSYLRPVGGIGRRSWCGKGHQGS